MKVRTLAKLLSEFFVDWLAGQQNMSPNTIASYRDAWCQLLGYAATCAHKPIAALQTEDLSAPLVVEFLNCLERDRGVSIATRNCRLAAVHSFFSFVSQREPALSEQCAAVLSVPHKRGSRHTPRYLDGDELAAILAAPDRATPGGFRDYVLLVLLYNTGARIQEALGLRPSDLRLALPAHVRVMGKGRKERYCPIWPETAKLLKLLLKRHPRLDDESLFANRYGAPLGPTGVRFRLAAYVQKAAVKVPSLATKRVSPHVFRHTCAVNMVGAGIEQTVIRGWLGHASIETTNVYAQTDLATKRTALERLAERSVPISVPRWRGNEPLLSWLSGLGKSANGGQTRSTPKAVPKNTGEAASNA